MMCLRKGNSWGKNKHKIVEKKQWVSGETFKLDLLTLKNDRFMNKCKTNGY